MTACSPSTLASILAGHVIHHLRILNEQYLQKRVRGIEELERRVAKLEKELAALKRTAPAKPKPKTAPRKPAA